MKGAYCLNMQGPSFRVICFEVEGTYVCQYIIPLKAFLPSWVNRGV